MNAQSKAESIRQNFEGLTLEGIPALGALYAQDAKFKDPFNDVQGRDFIEHIFRHMFSQVNAPQFVVTALMAQDHQIFMRWDFSFVARNSSQTIKGATYFELDAKGLIILHRDYWDAAEELYEKIPILGILMRWLRAKLKA